MTSMTRKTRLLCHLKRDHADSTLTNWSVFRLQAFSFKALEIMHETAHEFAQRPMSEESGER